MKYISKPLALLIIILLFIIMLPNYSMARDGDLSWSYITSHAGNFIDRGTKENRDLKATEIVKGAANTLTTIGVVLIIASLCIIGIMYMFASPDEAAKLKSKLVGIAIAGVVLLGAFGIWKISYNYLKSIDSSSATTGGTSDTEGEGEAETEGEATPTTKPEAVKS